MSVGRSLLPALVALLASAGLAACGAGDGGARTIADFRIEAPPLPPLTLPESGAPDAAQRTATDLATDGVARRDADPAPEDAGDGRVAPGAPTDAEIAAELRQAFRQEQGAPSTRRDIVDTVTLTSGGLAQAPPSAPRAVQAIVNAANQVATKPYVYGGGHGRLAGEQFVDTAYDCSGSISFAFASAGLVDRTMVSGDLARWGKPGPGKWVTIYAHGGHAWMTVGGLRFDTSGLKERGSRWQTATRSTAGFTVRHPPGL